MAAGRDPVDRLLDLVVAVPVCTLVAARRAVPIVGHVVARGIAPAVDRVANRVVGAGDEPTDVQPAPNLPDDAPGPAPVDADVPGAGGELPISDYDHLAARQVVDRLAGLRPDELELVAAYERAHRHRKTVLGKIEQLRS